jgi:hypothetical protein
LDNANTAVEVLSGLNDVASSFKEVASVAKKLGGVLDKLSAAGPILGAVAFILNIFTMFGGGPTEFEQTMDKLNEIEAQIERLDSRMHKEFAALDLKNQLRSCYN